MSEPTPGPWVVLHEHGEMIYVETETGIPLFVSEEKLPLDRMLANAHLAAAVHELRDALKWFIDDIDSTHTVMLDFDANVERARKALAKAQGQSDEC